jgi:RecA/RadA recombinase
MTKASTLLDTLRKSGSIESAVQLTVSPLFNQKDMIQTDIPILNVALSAKLDGGLVPGLTLVCGPSKHFKSLLSLIMVKAYMKKYPEAVCLFYDSEFGITPEYLTATGNDPDRFLHIPVEHIEQLKFDLSKRLEAIKRGDKVILMIDSVGNLASKKEVEDALNEKSVADMTRAKALKSLFRIVTPHLTTKDIPCVVVNHTYMEIGLFPKAVVGGGTGIYYSANTIFIIGRSQDKEGTELQGYNFTINIEKSRYVKEKSKLMFTVNFESGIERWSGLMDLALESGHVTRPTAQLYHVKGSKDKPVKLKNTDNPEFWIPILQDKTFQEFVTNKYQIGHRSMFGAADFGEQGAADAE